jgi:hypothetical protein
MERNFRLCRPREPPAGEATPRRAHLDGEYVLCPTNVKRVLKGRGAKHLNQGGFREHQNRMRAY